MTVNKFAVGTIEEDFKRIGLITEAEEPEDSEKESEKDDDEKDDEDDEDEKNEEKDEEDEEEEDDEDESSKSKKNGSDEDEPEEENESYDPEELAALEGLDLDDLEALEDLDDGVLEDVDEEEGEIEERMALRRRRRPSTKVRMQRRKAKLQRRRKRTSLARAARKWRRSARGKRFLRRYKQALRRFHGSVPRGKRVTLRAGLDNVSNLIEEVQDIVTSIDNVAKEEAIKTFANMALVANDLHEKFAYACDNLQVEDEDGNELNFCAVAEHFGGLAEESATIAEALHESMEEGVEIEGTPEEIQEAFSSIMSTILEGLELFADLSEQDVTPEPPIGKPAEPKPEGEDDEEDDEEEDEEKKKKKAAERAAGSPAEEEPEENPLKM